MQLPIESYHLCVLVWFSSVSVEDQGVGPLDDLALTEQTFPSQDGAGLRYSALISGEINRDGTKHKHTICYCYTLNIFKFSYSMQKHTHIQTLILFRDNCLHSLALFRPHCGIHLNCYMNSYQCNHIFLQLTIIQHHWGTRGLEVLIKSKQLVVIEGVSDALYNFL